MPKAFLTYEQRRRAEFEKDRNRQLRAIQGEIATTKYSHPIREIKKDVGFSEQVIKKVRKEPNKATLEQLFDYCYATGKRVVITIE